MRPRIIFARTAAPRHGKRRSCHAKAVVRHHRHGSDLDVVAQPRDRVGGGGLAGRVDRTTFEHRVRGKIAGNPREGDLTECGEGIKHRRRNQRPCSDGCSRRIRSGSRSRDSIPIHRIYHECIRRISHQTRVRLTDAVGRIDQCARRRGAGYSPRIRYINFAKRARTRQCRAAGGNRRKCGGVCLCPRIDVSTAPPPRHGKRRSCRALAVVRHHRHRSDLDVVAQPRNRVGGGGLIDRNGRAVVEHRVCGEIAGNSREGDLTECSEGIKGRGDRWQHVRYCILGL